MPNPKPSKVYLSSPVEDILNDLRYNRGDKDARAALRGALIEEGAHRVHTRQPTPAWLREVVRHFEWPIPSGFRDTLMALTYRMFDVRRAEAAREWQADMALHDGEKGHAPPLPRIVSYSYFDFCGRTWALGRWCFAAEPYQWVSADDQARQIEDLLWPFAVGVGLPHAWHTPQSSHRVLLVPLEKPPAGAPRRPRRG